MAAEAPAKFFSYYPPWWGSFPLQRIKVQYWSNPNGVCAEVLLKRGRHPLPFEWTVGGLLRAALADVTGLPYWGSAEVSTDRAFVDGVRDVFFVQRSVLSIPAGRPHLMVFRADESSGQ